MACMRCGKWRRLRLTIWRRSRCALVCIALQDASFATAQRYSEVNYGRGVKKGEGVTAWMESQAPKGMSKCLILSRFTVGVISTDN